MEKSIVTSIPINQNYQQAFHKSFSSFSSLENKLKKCSKVFIKICIDHFYELLHTHPSLLDAVLRKIRSVNPTCQIFIMENNLTGNFSRLLADVTGIKKVCILYKAKFLYLDERKVSPVLVGPGDARYKILFPNIVNDQLVSDRRQCVYINLTLLKTNYITKVAGGLFNQLGLIGQSSIGTLFSPHLHQTIVDILAYIQPDFTILDANYIVAHGGMPPQSLMDKYSFWINQLICGTDPVAVDRAGCEVMGYDESEIDHLRLAGAQKLGQCSLTAIEIKGTLNNPTIKIPYQQLISELPPKMDIVFGETTATDEAFLNFAISIIQILYKDFAGYGRFSILLGEHFTKEQLENLREPIIVLGFKTCKETASVLRERYIDVFYIDQYTKADQLIAVLLYVLGVGKYQFGGVNPFTLWRLLFIGRLRGLRYRMPQIRRLTKYWKEVK